MDDIRAGLASTHLSGDSAMPVDATEPMSPITAKSRALARSVRPSYTCYTDISSCYSLQARQVSKASGFTMEEAMELERQAHIQDVKRQEELLEKRRRRGLPIKGEVLTRQEQEARIWAFMFVRNVDMAHNFTHLSTLQEPQALGFGYGR